MSYYSRLNKSFEGALRLPLTDRSKYVLISDCHRGTGTSYDNFLKNQNLYFAALQHYYQYGYTYIELGDGDELWENRSMGQIIQTHSNVFWLLSLFRQEDRLYMLYGNHDMIKKNVRYTQKSCSTYYCSSDKVSFWEKQPLLPNMTFHSGIILENVPSPYIKDTDNSIDVYLTHGHQADLFNSTLWRFSRFLVRYFWRPLERFGVLDPTSAAQNYTRKRRTEQRLQQWAQKEKHILITGHTHRPSLSEEDKYYYNSGSCVHPRCITCLEIEYKRIRLVKWTLATKPDMTLYVSREVLAGPVYLVR
ncbi:MAG: serine/threonine protein phosphatase [Clostridiales bacterium]|nr:serine/threonine protein phosphatase [Clostridiales bacterium]